MREARLESAPYCFVASDEIAGLQQQVEEVQRARSRLQLLVAVNSAHQFLLERRREVCVGIQAKAVEIGAERFECLHDGRARDPLPVSGPTAVADPREIALARQIDESRFEPVVVSVRRRVPNPLFLQLNLLAQMSRGRGIEVERIVGI
jgi:hypothetical protein